jgi:hypothetical protein
MKLTLELPGAVRVVATTDYKGSPLTAVLIGDTEVLFADGHEPGGLTPAMWEDVISTRLAHVLARLLLDEAFGGLDGELWSAESPTGRETWGRESAAYEVRLVPDPEAGP